MGIQPGGNGLDTIQLDCCLAGPYGEAGLCVGCCGKGNQFTRPVGKLEPIDNVDERFGPWHHASCFSRPVPDRLAATVSRGDPQHKFRQNDRHSLGGAGVTRHDRCNCRLHGGWRLEIEAAEQGKGLRRAGARIGQQLAEQSGRHVGPASPDNLTPGGGPPLLADGSLPGGESIVPATVGGNAEGLSLETVASGVLSGKPRPELVSPRAGVAVQGNRRGPPDSG